MAAIELFPCNPLSLGGIKKLRLATRDTSEDPLDFPLDFTLKSNDESTILVYDDEYMRTVTIGNTDASYRIIYPLNATITEEETTDRRGRYYKITLNFELPQLNLTTTNQLKDFLFTDSGEFAISNMFAIITDMNNNDWIVGYTQPLVLESLELMTGIEGEDSKYVLSYIANSYDRIRAVEYYNIPDVTTVSLTPISLSAITAIGNVTDDNYGIITERGFCWTTGSTPTILDDKISTTGTTGLFTVSITGLTTGITYNIRPYAINVYGTGYGNVIGITLSMPIITTSSVSWITGTTATGGGNLINIGYPIATVMGVCWDTSTGTTIGDSHTIQTASSGLFISTLTGLTPNTWYTRAYATNVFDTVYGGEETFDVTQLPTVVTSAVTYTSGTTAIGGGNVTDGGYPIITARGVCWSTGSTPTIADAHTTQTGTTGIFSSTLTGLTTGMTYYICAYATNMAGTAYGNELLFYTPQNVISGLVVSWPFQNSLVDTVSGVTLGLIGSGSYQTGKIGNAIRADSYNFKLDTTNITLRNRFKDDNIFSVSMWVNIPSTTNNWPVVYLDDANVTTRWAGFVISGSTMVVRYKSKAGVHTNYDSVPLNEWFHFVWTYDGTTNAFYVNNDSRGGTSDTGTLNVYIINIPFRQELGDWEQGLIDQVYVYDHVLTTDEISRMYNYGIGC